MAEVGVLVMAYGTPAGPDHVEAYYTHIRRGRPPPADLLADLIARYQAIGGVSPLREITQRQATGIQHALDGLEPGRYRVFLGLKHAAPFIEDTAAEIAAADLDRVVGLVLAPHHSTMSVAEYHRRAREALGEGIAYRGVESWYDEPTYIAYLAHEVQAAVERIPEELHPDTHVLFTAHSLPTRIVQEGDTYPVQLRQTAELVSDALDLSRRTIAWQSAGRTADPWLGPDILEVLPALAEAHGIRAVVVCPCGFVADHLEVLYDVDIEARRVAEDHGLRLERTRMPNDDPAFCALLADVVRRHADHR